GGGSVKRAAVLAVDGGGSKIDAVLIRREGTLLGAARIATGAAPDGGPGEDEHMRPILEATRAAAGVAGRDPAAAPLADLGVFCLSGADLPVDDRRIVRWLRRHGLATEDVVRNDSFAVLRAGTERSWGVGVVCGFGTNCSGVAPDGRVTRFPAIGPVSGDFVGGGVFRSGWPPFLGRIEWGVRAFAPDARVLVLDAPPVVGAALIGLDHIGARGGAYRRVRAGLTHERLTAKTAARRGPRPRRETPRARRREES